MIVFVTFFMFWHWVQHSEMNSIGMIERKCDIVQTMLLILNMLKVTKKIIRLRSSNSHFAWILMLMWYHLPLMRHLKVFCADNRCAISQKAINLAPFHGSLTIITINFYAIRIRHDICAAIDRSILCARRCSNTVAKHCIKWRFLAFRHRIWNLNATFGPLNW